MSSRSAIAVGAMLLLAVPLTVHADDEDGEPGADAPGVTGDPADLLERAQLAIDDIDYETAQVLTTEALERGGLGEGQLALAHHLAGVVAAALGDASAAGDHFLHWVLLDRLAELPEDESPKITERFAAAKAEAERLGGFGAEMKFERVPGKLRISLEIQDPLGMIATFRARLMDGSNDAMPAVTASSPTDTVELPVDDAQPVAFELFAYDAKGNQLLTRGDSAQPLEVVVVVTPRIRSRRFPTVVRWPTWTALAGVAAGVGGFFVWRLGKDEDELAAFNAAPELHTVDEAEAVRDRGDRNAMGANIALGVAGAAAVAAILTFVLEPEDIEIAPVAGSNSAGATATIRF